MEVHHAVVQVVRVVAELVSDESVSLGSEVHALAWAHVEFPKDSHIHQHDLVSLAEEVHVVGAVGVNANVDVDAGYEYGASP